MVVLGVFCLCEVNLSFGYQSVCCSCNRVLKLSISQAILSSGYFDKINACYLVRCRGEYAIVYDGTVEDLNGFDWWVRFIGINGLVVELDSKNALIVQRDPFSIARKRLVSVLLPLQL